MAARGPERGADCPGCEGHELVADHVPLGARRFLQKTAILEVADEAVRGCKGEGDTGRDLGRRDGLPLSCYEGEDRQSAA